MADVVIRIPVDLDPKGEKGVRALGRAVAQVDKNAGNLTGSLRRAGEVLLGGLARDAVVGSIRALNAAVDESFQSFLQFDKGIAEVNTLLDENQKLTAETTDTFIRFSDQFGGSAANQAKAFYQIVSAGVGDVAKATDVLEASNRAAVAGISDTQTAADVLTSVLNTYGDAAGTATDVSDVLFATVKAGKTTFEELASTLGRAAPIAAAAGVKFSELAGTTAFLTKSGISTDEAITSVRAAITSVIKPTDDAVKFAKQLGIQFDTAAIRSKTFAGFMDEVRIKTGGSEKAMARLFPNVRALTGVLAISGKNFQEFASILDDTADATDATANAFSVIENSASFQFETLTQKIENFGLRAFQAFEPVIAQTLKFTSEAIDGFDRSGIKLNGFVEAFATLIEITDRGLEISKIFFDVMKVGFTGLVLPVQVIVAQFFELLSAIPLIGSAFDDLAASSLSVLQDKAKDFTGSMRELGNDITNFFSEDRGLQRFADQLRTIDLDTKKVAASSVDAAAGADAHARATRALAGLTPKIKEFTEAQVEAGKAGRQLASQLGVADISARFEQQSEQLRLAREQDLITEEQFQIALDELRERFELARQEKQATQIEADIRRRDLLLQLNAAGNQAEIQALDKKIKTQLNQEQNASNKIIQIKVRERDRRRKLLDRQLSDSSEFFGNLNTIAGGNARALFNIQKAVDIARATTTGFFAIQTAIASAPFPANIPAIAFATAKTGANIASIARTNLQTGITSVPPGFPNDSFAANLTTGERVLNVPQNRDLTRFMAAEEGTRAIQQDVLNELRIMNARGRNTIVMIDGREVVTTVQDELDRGRDLTA